MLRAPSRRLVDRALSTFRCFVAHGHQKGNTVRHDRGIPVPFFGENAFRMTGLLNPFRDPEPLPILTSSKIVPKKGFQW